MHKHKSWDSFHELFMQDGQKKNIHTLIQTGMEEISKSQALITQNSLENSSSPAVGCVMWDLPGAGMGSH